MTLRRRVVGKTAEHGCRRQPPRKAPSQWNAVEEAVEVCVSNRRSGRGLRGGWVVRFFSGLPLALSNDRGLAPAPPRHRAREVPTCPNKAVGAAARRLGRLSRFPTALQPPPPRRGACAIIVPIKRLNCRCPSARRRWRWAVRLRNGFSVGTGATRAAMPPKTERGGSVPNEFAPNLPRSVFRLRRASPPCPMKSGRFRAQHTATPAGAAPRAAFGYSRANGDSTRTLRGRSARGARIGRPSIGGRVRTMTVARVDDGRGAVGVWGAAKTAQGRATV